MIILTASKLATNYQHPEVIKSIFIFLTIIAIAFIANYITKTLIIRIVNFLVYKSKNKFDDAFLKRKVFRSLSHFVPAMIIYLGANFIFNKNIHYPFDYLLIINLIKNITYLYMLIVSIVFANRFLNALNDIYEQFPIAKNISIKGFIQVIKILLILLAIILVVALILNKKPTVVLTGLGAIAAVLMLVFKDTILGFVASIQLQAYDMIKPGDWIQVPGANADGNVIEISLATVKIQNWDKTITTIPPYQLVSKPFVNWKGMELSGGRRIKRSVYIDMKSVCFLNDQDIAKFEKIRLLKDYLTQKKKEIQEYNRQNQITDLEVVNGRKLTNLGTFRKYLEFYLKNHPRVKKDFTLLVRHLQPTPQGLPIEIYVFSADNRWAQMEELQADIFDHILAVIPEFGLRVYQEPSGHDFEQFAQKKLQT